LKWLLGVPNRLQHLCIRICECAFVKIMRMFDLTVMWSVGHTGVQRVPQGGPKGPLSFLAD
jgi:hypothetical protein